MNEPMMDGGMMMACRIATTLFALVIRALVIAQTVLQTKILREPRRVHAVSPPVHSRIEVKP